MNRWIEYTGTPLDSSSWVIPKNLHAAVNYGDSYYDSKIKQLEMQIEELTRAVELLSREVIACDVKELL